MAGKDIPGVGPWGGVWAGQEGQARSQCRMGEAPGVSEWERVKRGDALYGVWLAGWIRSPFNVLKVRQAETRIPLPVSFLVARLCCFGLDPRARLDQVGVETY